MEDTYNICVSLTSCCRTILTLCGCCCVPCIRHLGLKCITTADDKFPAPPPYQLVQHPGEIITVVSVSEPGDEETEDDKDTEDHCLYA